MEQTTAIQNIIGLHQVESGNYRWLELSTVTVTNSKCREVKKDKQTYT